MSGTRSKLIGSAPRPVRVRVARLLHPGVPDHEPKHRLLFLAADRLEVADRLAVTR